MDTTTREVRRREVVSEHGLQPEGRTWAGDTLWWSTFALHDVGSASGSTSSFLARRPGTCPTAPASAWGSRTVRPYVRGWAPSDSGSLVATSGRRVVRHPGPGAGTSSGGDRQLSGRRSPPRGPTVVTTAYARGTGRFADRPTERCWRPRRTDGRLTVRPLRVEGYAPETLTPWGGATRPTSCSRRATSRPPSSPSTSRRGRRRWSAARSCGSRRRRSRSPGRLVGARARRRRAPAHPFDPRAGRRARVVVVVLVGAAGVGLWRRRVRP